LSWGIKRCWCLIYRNSYNLLPTIGFWISHWPCLCPLTWQSMLTWCLSSKIYILEYFLTSTCSSTCCFNIHFRSSQFTNFIFRLINISQPFSIICAIFFSYWICHNLKWSFTCSSGGLTIVFYCFTTPYCVIIKITVSDFRWSKLWWSFILIFDMAKWWF